MASALASRVAPGLARPAIATRAPRARSSVKVAAGNAAWLPGTEAPAHLEAQSTLPGNFGFDPLNLGQEPEKLKWYVQAELQNGRWAMLGVFGILFPELLYSIGLKTAPGLASSYDWFEAGKLDYGIPNNTLIAIEFFLFAWVEGRRLQDYNKPGSANQDPIFSGNKLPDGNVPGYPGGIFDPLGFAKGGDVASLRQKEIKNGRLAMVAFLGFLGQHAATGKTPLAALGEHLADPFAKTALTNGVSVPFLH